MIPLVEALTFALIEVTKNAPKIRASVAELLSKKEPTAADRAAFRKRVASQTYETLVPNTALKK